MRSGIKPSCTICCGEFQITRILVIIAFFTNLKCNRPFNVDFLSLSHNSNDIMWHLFGDSTRDTFYSWWKMCVLEWRKKKWLFCAKKNRMRLEKRSTLKFPAESHKVTLIHGKLLQSIYWITTSRSKKIVNYFHR